MLVAPKPERLSLAVFISVVSDHVEPLYNSTFSVAAGANRPPAAIADVCIPAPPNSFLTPAKSPDSVHVLPLYSSVAPVLDGAAPPKTNPAVCIPAPAEEYLPVFKFPPDAHAPVPAA